MSPEPRGSTTGNTYSRPSNDRSSETESPQHVYRGRRDPTAPVGQECIVTVDGDPLDSRYDLLSASPSGFEWGYGGSGPAQLAVAILADAYDGELAVSHYQQFKREVVADLPKEGWSLTKTDLNEWRGGVISHA